MFPEYIRIIIKLTCPLCKLGMPILLKEKERWVLSNMCIHHAIERFMHPRVIELQKNFGITLADALPDIKLPSKL